MHFWQDFEIRRQMESRVISRAVIPVSENRTEGADGLKDVFVLKRSSNSSVLNETRIGQNAEHGGSRDSTVGDQLSLMSFALSATRTAINNWVGDRPSLFLQQIYREISP
jgi:hypothetical protein